MSYGTKFKNEYLRRAKVTSVLSILQLFQAHSAFRCVVMGANASFFGVFLTII